MTLLVLKLLLVLVLRRGLMHARTRQARQAAVLLHSMRWEGREG